MKTLQGHELNIDRAAGALIDAIRRRPDPTAAYLLAVALDVEHAIALEADPPQERYYASRSEFVVYERVRVVVFDPDHRDDSTEIWRGRLAVCGRWDEKGYWITETIDRPEPAAWAMLVAFVDDLSPPECRAPDPSPLDQPRAGAWGLARGSVEGTDEIDWYESHELAVMAAAAFRAHRRRLGIYGGVSMLRPFAYIDPKEIQQHGND